MECTNNRLLLDLSQHCSLTVRTAAQNTVERGLDMFILWWIVVGIIAGWITGKIMSGGGYGVFMDMAALFTPFLWPLEEP